MALSRGMRLTRVLVITGIVGAGIGFALRLLILGTHPKAMVIATTPGKLAVMCVMIGAYAVVSGFIHFATKNVALKMVLGTLLLTGGLAWGIPLGH